MTFHGIHKNFIAQNIIVILVASSTEVMGAAKQIEKDKIDIIEWVRELNDELAIAHLKALKNSYGSTDWWDDLSEEAKAAIELGLRDIEEGNVVPHSEVLKKYERWL